MPAAQTVASSATPTDFSTPTDLASPASQVGAALVAFTASGTSNTLTVQLQPVELGKVQISVTNDAGGPATVQVIAERPETLALLQRDQAQLSQTLDQAGIASAGRTIIFQLAAPPPITQTTDAARVNPAAATNVAQTGTTNPASDAAVAANAPVGAPSPAVSTAAPAPTPLIPQPEAALQSGLNNGSTGHSAFTSQPMPQTLQSGLSGGGQGGQSYGGQSQGFQSGFAFAQQAVDDTADLFDDETAPPPPAWTPSSLNIMA